jgi:glutamate-5-semialdehyde dehydrogenase
LVLTTGGKESIESFKTISSIISQALTTSEVPNDALQLVTTRDAIAPLLKLDQYIDLVIPRGGNELVQSVKSSTQIPVLGHADGLCTTYLKADYPSEDAVRIILDAKLSYAAACNSIETLLVDEAALDGNFVAVAKALIAKGVELRCDGPARAMLSKHLKEEELSKVKDVTEQDYKTEFLDLILAVKTIPTKSTALESADVAIEHTNTYSSHHTDAILTTDASIAEYYLSAIDSAGVFWNTSTRMADGQRFGFGTEVGISTNKIHARGPVGLEGLMIYRWLIRGKGHVTTQYGSHGKKWTHQRLPAGEDEWIAKDAAELEALRAFRAKREMTNGTHSKCKEGNRSGDG